VIAQSDWQPLADSNLEVAFTDRAGSEIFRIFFSGYDRAFVLPNEKEDEAGFKACLDLNHNATGATLARQYGPFVERCMIARDRITETFVGGANFIAAIVRDEGRPRVAANLNYIYVDAGARGQGYFGTLVRAVRDTIAGSLPGVEGDPLIFLELNDPIRMSEQDYERDTAFTGLDQLDRLRIWARQGARIVDHDYAQPPLGADQQADLGLIYGLLTDKPDLSACTLSAHLRRFFAISVLKGRAVHDSPVACAQLDELDAMCVAGKRVDILDPAPLLLRLKRQEDFADLPSAAATSTRTAIHALRE
jgi:hypothetical protein